MAPTLSRRSCRSWTIFGSSVAPPSGWLDAARFRFGPWAALVLGLSCSSRPAERTAAAPPASAAASHAATPSSAAPPSAVCVGFARAYCERVAACTPGLLASDHGDVGTCSARWASWCTRTQALSNSGFSDERVRGCQTAVAASECRRWREFDDLAIPACHPAGNAARGEPCLEHAQCATGLCLRDPTRYDSACGTCELRAKPGGECFMGYVGPRLGCAIGSACSRGICIGPLMDEGEPCGAGSAWSSDCYGDGMFGRGGNECRERPQPSASFGVCERDRNYRPCGPGSNCPSGAREGELCGDVPERGEIVACAFPLLCVSGKCAHLDPACR